MAETLSHLLPHVNAGLNALATLLLIVGYVLIKQRRETAHKWAMMLCFGVSVVFLACYLTHKGALYASTGEWNKRFPASYGDSVRYGYYLLLASHLLLAIVTPFLAIGTIVLGWRDNRVAHRKWAKITFPIWLYVSITGVLVYFMLYRWFPASA
jgi:putative membrane protein